MKYKTMREAYTELGVSRTTLQSWFTNTDGSDNPNKWGILSGPSRIEGRDWLFDEDMMTQLWEIRFYKELKYSNAEVRELLFGSKNREERLEQQIAELTREKEKLEQLINIATMMKETGVSPKTLRSSISGLDDVSYVMVKHLAGFISSLPELEAELEISDEDDEIFSQLLEQVFDQRTPTAGPHEDWVQMLVGQQFDIICNSLVSSTNLFASYAMIYYPDTKVGRMVDEAYGTGSAKFYADAVKHFCDHYTGPSFEQELQVVFDRIIDLAWKKYKTTSAEVQEQVCIVHKLYSKLVKTESDAIVILRRLAEYYGSEDVRKECDGGKRGAAWFLSRVLDIYCKRWNEKKD